MGNIYRAHENLNESAEMELSSERDKNRLTMWLFQGLLTWVSNINLAER